MAAFILQRMGRPLDAYTLQKLTYYSQAWSLVWDGRRLFDDPIEAWAEGPVVRRLYADHRGQYMVSSVQTGDPQYLSAQDIANIDAVIDYYGRFSGNELSQMTHEEAPWLEARGDLKPKARSQAVISTNSMTKFYTRQQAEGVEGPRRKAYPRTPSSSDLMTEARLQLARWRNTLDRMDDR